MHPTPMQEKTVRGLTIGIAGAVTLTTGRIFPRNGSAIWLAPKKSIDNFGAMEYPWQTTEFPMTDTDQIQYENETIPLTERACNAMLKRRGSDGWLLTAVTGGMGIFARPLMTPIVDRTQIRADTVVVRNALVHDSEYNLSKGREAFERLVDYLDGRISFGERP